MPDTYCIFCGQYVVQPCPGTMTARECMDAKMARKEIYVEPKPEAVHDKINHGVFEDCGCAKRKPKDDPVHQPKHYARWAMQPIEFIAANDFPFWLANVIKYACRYDAKDGLQDLYKARAYLDMQIRKLEGHDKFWEAPVATQQELVCATSAAE